MAPNHSSVLSRTLVLLASAAAVSSAVAQTPRPKGKANDTYAQLCANCHGKNLEGGQTPSGNKVPSLLDDEWLHGGDDESIARSIRNGYPEKEMPVWSATMPDKEIRAMVIYLREQQAAFKRGQIQFPKPQDSVAARSQLHDFMLNTWIGDVKEPYSLAFLPQNRAIFTLKTGEVYVVENGRRAEKTVQGIPQVDTANQAGLFDVVPHPDYARNGWLYFAYSDPQTNDKGEKVSLTRIIRGKLKSADGGWSLVEQQTVYQAPVEVYPPAGKVHFGGRIAFDRAGYLYFSIGERGNGANAQNLAVPMGKIHRLHDDGRVPKDNPFAKDASAVPSIWSYGHRNPQGLAFHPVTGKLYDSEHGPRGGDELNLVQPKRNYGWPVITFGMNYDGSAMTDITAKEGMEQPVTYWTPSLAVCGINFYTGDRFPKWKNHLFLTSLAAQELRRIELKDDKVVAQEVIFKDLGRIRHVIGGPDGALYVLLPTRIARLAPAAEKMTGL